MHENQRELYAVASPCINWGGQLSIIFGSSYKTRDFIVDTLEAWWAALDAHEQVAMARLQIKMDNGPESSGKRTPFLQRMVGVLRCHW